MTGLRGFLLFREIRLGRGESGLVGLGLGCGGSELPPARIIRRRSGDDFLFALGVNLFRRGDRRPARLKFGAGLGDLIELRLALGVGGVEHAENSLPPCVQIVGDLLQPARFGEEPQHGDDIAERGNPGVRSAAVSTHHGSEARNDGERIAGVDRIEAGLVGPHAVGRDNGGGGMSPGQTARGIGIEHDEAGRRSEGLARGGAGSDRDTLFVVGRHRRREDDVAPGVETQADEFGDEQRSHQFAIPACRPIA